MITSGNFIKNPLTIIAIFAGIVEIGSNTVLPFLTPENQSTYIWFLMLFPLVLILIFFYILYNKHHVLYAPSDFNNEDNFNELFFNTRKSTSKELDKKLDDEIKFLKIPEKNIKKEVGVRNINLTSKSEKFTNLIRHNRSHLLTIENRLIDKFSKNYNYHIERDITLEINNEKLICDGFIQQGNYVNIIEVKNLSHFMSVSQIIYMIINRKYNLLTSFSENKNMTLSFIILTPDDRLKNKYKEFEKNFNEKYENFSNW